MAEEASAARPPDAEFLQMWGDSFSQALGQITGSSMPCSLLTEAPADFPGVADGDFWIIVTCSGSLRGEMALRLTAATVLRLAQIFMGEPAAPDAPLSADHREAVIELMRQVSGIFATAAKVRCGEVQLGVEQAAGAPSWPPATAFWLQTAGEGQAAITLEFGLSAALAAELRAEKAEAAKAGSAPAAAQSAATSPPSAASAADTGAMDLLMDVQLAVTLRFGSRRLLLREVLELSPGEVVELDRKVQEPVDLLLEGKVVARGDLVVIDGNYGLRVTDVSPMGTR